MLIAILGCGTPLLWPEIAWEYYWAVNVPVTLTLIILDMLMSRKFDQLERRPSISASPDRERDGELNESTDEVVSAGVCRLPVELLEERPRLVKDLKVGESAPVLFTAMVVDLDRKCYVRPSDEIRSHPSFNTIEIKRTEDGVEVRLRPDDRYKARAVSERDLLPVTAIHFVLGTE